MGDNQKIVVISGASSGIGLCAAEHLGKLGNYVLAGARETTDIKSCYHPGRRLIPDFLAAKLPQKLVDRLLARIGSD